jgi:L-threonylcarbamoyladenylate synthase
VSARVVRDDAAGREAAIAALRAGGIVAMPTDTVYGICVGLATPGGIERLFEAKRRPPEKGIQLLLADAAQAAEVGVMGPLATALVGAFWPGGLTVVVPQRPDVALPAALTGGRPTIGLRLPDHPAPRALAAAVGPIPATSANRSGWPEGRDAADILDQVGDSVDLVLDGGPAHGGPPSTVIDCTGELPVALRVGAVSLERIAGVLDIAGIRHALAGGEASAEPSRTGDIWDDARRPRPRGGSGQTPEGDDR